MKEDGDASGDNRDGSAAPSANEGGETKDEPVALLQAIGKIASGRLDEVSLTLYLCIKVLNWFCTALMFS